MDRHEHLKELLLKHKDELTSDLQVRLHLAQARGDDRGDRLDGHDAEFDTERELNLAIIQLKDEALRRTEKALQQLEEGRYGQCQDCGNEIAPQRLRALPFAIRCKPCEEANERLSAASRRRDPLFRVRAPGLREHL